MIETTLYRGEAWKFIKGLPDNSIDSIITDPPYNATINLEELRRVCAGNIITFCRPENQFFRADEYAFWIKTPSTKNYSSHLGRFVEMILIQRGKGSAYNPLHWSNMTGVYDDRLILPPVHPHQKPISLMERLVRIYSNPEDKVLDPFMGSGTTIQACVKLGRDSIGCEIDKEIFEIAKRLINQQIPDQLEYIFKQEEEEK